MAFCGEASTWAKVSLVLMILALGMQATGYGTNYWMARYTATDKANFGLGLWRMTDCSGYYNAPCSDTDVPDSYIDAEWQAVRALESCALVFMFVTMVCLIFYVGHQRSRTRGMAIAMMILGFLAAACSMAEMTVWLVTIPQYHYASWSLGMTAACSVAGMTVWLVTIPQYHYASWSLGMTVFAATLAITSAILIIPDIREYDYKDTLKVGGQFNNLPVTEEAPPPPPPPPQVYQHEELKPVIVPQNPMAAPSYQFLQYDKRRHMDGF